MSFSVRPARTGDIRFIQSIVEPQVQRRILLGKELVDLYEAVQEFRVAEDADGVLIGCRALHVMWEALGEVRTRAVVDEWRHRKVGHAMLEQIEEDARALGLRRLFCLTFEVDFFGGHGFEPMGEQPIDQELYAQLLRSSDEGVAEFLDLARVKQNTLGNTRMLKTL